MRLNLVIIPAASGTPRKTMTLHAISIIETSTTEPAPGDTMDERKVTKNHASGLYMIIWKTEFNATRIAQDSLQPPAIMFHISTMAIHRASPTRIIPVR